MKTEYPFQNLQLQDLPGERWKVIPGFNDYYLLSNLGRLKSLARTVARKDGFFVNIPERIKKVMIHTELKTLAEGRKTTQINVIGAISVEAHKYAFHLNRYMYYLYVQPFDMNDVRLRVVCKDGNRLNILPHNLKLSTMAEFHKKQYEDKIRKRKFYNREAIKVVQKTMNGEFVAEYPSMKVASISTGIDHASIYRTVIGEYKQYKGFIFERTQPASKK